MTEIGRDGTLEGPAFGQLGAVLAASGIPLVASGGVGTLDDLRALARLRSGDRGLAGIIVGRALYEDRFGVEDALAALAGSRGRLTPSAIRSGRHAAPSTSSHKGARAWPTGAT